MLSPAEQRLLQRAAGLLTDRTDPREQQARQIILGVISDKEHDDKPNGLPGVLNAISRKR